MRSELMKYATAEVPRYTSYPTAVQFHDGVDPDIYRQWLAELRPDDRLSAYVHIPFCAKLCWYCGCHTTVPNSYVKIMEYTDVLVREIELVASQVPNIEGISHLHFGGGTPTVLTEKDMARVMSALRDGFGLSAGAEVAVEMDPRGMTQEKVAGLAKNGVTRVSLGVQDFDPVVQEKINRIQSFDLVENTVTWLRGAGISDINFDLMYGLPTQTVDGAARSAELAVKLKPSRLAVFGYAHVPWFKKHQQMISEDDLPGMEERLAQAETVNAVLRQAGYVDIGFDHYALPDDPMAKALTDGTLRRNFQGYTDDPADVLIGFGASSIGETRNGFVQNNPHTLRWAEDVLAGRLPIARGVARTDDDRLHGAAIERILCNGELDLAEHCLRFGERFDALDEALPGLAVMASDGLLQMDGRKLTLTEDGRRFARPVAASFDKYLQQKAEKRHSVAV